MHEGYIYKYTNITNNKVYVGQTNSIQTRHKGHASCNRIDPFHSAIKHYGMDNFKLTILEHIFDEDKDSLRNRLNELEKKYIILEDSKFPNGYNLTDGGEGAPGRKLSDEHKRKISEANTGRKHTEETKLKLRGRTLTKEQREKLSNSLKGKPAWNKGIPMSKETIQKQIINRSWFYEMGGPNKGKKLSKEHKEKISKSHIGKKLSESSKQKLAEYNRTHPEKYDSMRGVPISEERKQHLSRVHKGKQYTKGKIWVHNESKTTLINPEDLQEYINNGWVRGRKLKKNNCK